MFDGTGEKFDEFSKSSASCQTKTIQIIVIINKLLTDILIYATFFGNMHLNPSTFTEHYCN